MNKKARAPDGEVYGESSDSKFEQLYTKVGSPRILEFSNDIFGDSRLSLQPILGAMQSTLQIYKHKSWATASGLTVNALFWLHNFGLEGQLKSESFSSNQSVVSSSLQQQEFRLHKRWKTEFPYGLARVLELSIFGGLEFYKNTRVFFAPKYSLTKLGMHIEFPWHSVWSGGGEFIYGLSEDKSNKKEVSGHINYYFKKDISFGLGYRIHLFEALSRASSPDGHLPYREGYTEGFSTFNYYY